VEASGKPPIFSMRSSLRTLRASSRVFPWTSSVSAEPHAIAGTQPFARKRTSVMPPAAALAVNWRMSPQAGFFDLDSGVGVFDLTGVARVLKVVEDLR